MITKDTKRGIFGRKYPGKITFDMFLDSIPPKFRESYEFFDKRIKELGGFYSMGTKGFTAYVPVKDKKLRLFEGYPNTISLLSKNYFEKYVNKDQVVVGEEAIIDYEDKISKISPFKNSFKFKKIYPFYKYEAVKPDELKDYFDFIIEWCKKWIFSEK